MTTTPKEAEIRRNARRLLAEVLMSATVDRDDIEVWDDAVEAIGLDLSDEATAEAVYEIAESMLGDIISNLERGD